MYKCSFDKLLLIWEMMCRLVQNFNSQTIKTAVFICFMARIWDWTQVFATCRNSIFKYLVFSFQSEPKVKSRGKGKCFIAGDPIGLNSFVMEWGKWFLAKRNRSLETLKWVSTYWQILIRIYLPMIEGKKTTFDQKRPY